MEKYQQGIISREEVVNKSQDPTTIIQKLAEWEAAQAERPPPPNRKRPNERDCLPSAFPARFWI